MQPNYAAVLKANKLIDFRYVEPGHVDSCNCMHTAAAAAAVEFYQKKIRKTKNSNSVVRRVFTVRNKAINTSLLALCVH